uniref:Uncharacterized protein n=1 Tax=Arundo donax TaxID=35708 RepID=A0A0A9B1A9_ARUDO
MLEQAISIKLGVIGKTKTREQMQGILRYAKVNWLNGSEVD